MTIPKFYVKLKLMNQQQFSIVHNLIDHRNDVQNLSETVYNLHNLGL